MPQLSMSNYLVLIMALMLAWICVKAIAAAVRLNRTYELFPNKILYPANCRPEDCQDPAGFIRFMVPRLWIFGLAGIALSVFLILNEFTGLLASFPTWFSQGASLFLFLPLFVWYIAFINKAAKRFW